MNNTPHHASAQLGRDSIGRLLCRFAVPSILGMVANALYCVVDRMYLGRMVGPDALGGMTLTFPVMSVITAFGMLIGAGTGALISISLGRGDRADAEKCLGQAVALFLLMYVALAPPALYYLDDLLNALGGTPDMVPHARDYLQIILAGNIVQHLSFGLNQSIRAEGFPMRALSTLLIGAILNIVIDPFFIFPEFLGWGVRGAAVATLVSQGASSVWVLAHFLSPHSACRLRLKNIRIHPALAWRVAGIGLTPFSIQFIAGIVAATFNLSFRHYLDEAMCNLHIAAMGTISMITLLFFMPMFGLTHGMQPVAGYNFGAKNYERLRDAYYLTLKVAVAIGVAGALACWVFAPQLARLFAPKPEHAELREIIPRYLRVVTLASPVVGFSITTSQYFQSIGKIRTALIMSWLRQVIVLLPTLLILPRFIGFEGIWYSSPASDFASFCVALVFFCHERRRLRALIQTPH